MKEDIFRLITENSNKIITLGSGITFTYTVENDSIFIKSKNLRITRADINSALKYMNNHQSPKNQEMIKLSYICAIIKNAKK